jgi:hypothetical protein
MRAAKLLEAPFIATLIFFSINVMATVGVANNRTWPFFSWIENAALQFAGLRRVLEPLEFNSCAATVLRYVAVSGVVSFVVSAAVLVLVLCGGVEYAKPSYLVKRGRLQFLPLTLARGTVCLTVAGFIFWYTWFFSGLAPHDRPINCALLNDEKYFLVKTWVISAVAHYLFLTSVRDLLGVAKATSP